MLSKTDPTLSIVVTNLDHDGNVTPWTLMAEERGIAVRRSPIICFLKKRTWKNNLFRDDGIPASVSLLPEIFLFRVNFKPGCCLLDLDHLERELDDKTKLVALFELLSN